MIINEIENKKCHICHNTKTPIELVSDKVIMYIHELNSPNSSRQIDHPNYISLSKKAIKLDDIFEKYFKKILIEDVICKNCSLVHSEEKPTFTVWIHLK